VPAPDVVQRMLEAEVQPDDQLIDLVLVMMVRSCGAAVVIDVQNALGSS